MYKKILVPLDGSQYSQCVLEHVKTIALAFKVPEVVVFRAVEPLPDDVRNNLVELGGEQIPKLESKRNNEAQDYVSAMAKTLGQEGLHARGEVAHGKAAEEIVNYAEKNKFDLIIMSTHGRTGDTKQAMGSVAERVINHSGVPVQLISPRECRTKGGL
jgi:nucleotide-binding universal stress UspA family protein